MKVPCPSLSLDPWSPVGYQVVEVADEQVPVPRPQAGAGEESAPRLPWATPGCRVVQVAEEQSPVSRHRAALRPRRQGPVRELNPNAFRGILLLVGLVVGSLVFVLGLSAAGWLRTSSQPPPGEPTTSAFLVAVTNDPDGDGDGRAGGMGRCRPALCIQLPKYDPAATPEKGPVPDPAAVAGLGGNAGQVCANPAERETFGTSVQFVRNPFEAARIAGAERKLTFLLHVSGNFEDDRFT